MMKHISNIVGCAILGICLTACNDQLDIEQHGVLNSDTYYKTDEDAAEVLTAVYNDIAAMELMYFDVKNLLSDDVYRGAESYLSHDLWDFGFDASHQYIEVMFANYYNVIGKCNAVIDNLQGESDAINRAKAEAKVVRAWMYFELTTLWGTPPLVDHLLSASNTSIPNASQEELWAFIEQDLNDAISSGMLPQKSDIDDNTLYHVSKQYAQALLGKALLWQGKNAEAAAALEQVINSGLYGLFEGNYGDVLSVKYENNRESMFESNFIMDDANPNACFRLYHLFLGINSQIFQTGDNELGFGVVGWSGFQPKGDLYQAFVKEEGEDGYRLNESIKTLQYLNEHGYTIRSGMTLYSEGYQAWKGRQELEACGTVSYWTNENNIRWMRYAEVLLLAAEANLGAGNQAKADQYLNEVRHRARLSDKTATLEAIKTEKRLELCWECVRFQDLVRWGDAYEALKDQGKQVPTVGSNGVVEWRDTGVDGGFKKGKHELLPFPSSEIRVNKNIKQNPNW